MIHNLKGIVAAGAALVMFSLPLGATQNGLATLYTQLRAAQAGEAAAIEREIRREWGRSGSVAMDVLLRRGLDAMERGEWNVAIEHLTALTDHAPDFAEGWQTRARAFFKAERLGEAMADLERALALDPDHFTAIFGIGAIYEVLEEPQRALAAYRLAMEVHPHYQEAAEAIERLRAQVGGQTL